MAEQWHGEITVGEPLVMRVEIDDLDIANWTARLQHPEHVPRWVRKSGDDDDVLPVALLDKPRKGDTATARHATDEEVAAGICLVGLTPFVST